MMIIKDGKRRKEQNAMLTAISRSLKITQFNLLFSNKQKTQTNQAITQHADVKGCKKRPKSNQGPT